MTPVRIPIHVSSWQFECCRDLHGGAWFWVGDEVSWLLTVAPMPPSSVLPASEVTLASRRLLDFEHQGKVREYAGPDEIWANGNGDLPPELVDPAFSEDHPELVLEDHDAAVETRGTITRICELRLTYTEGRPTELLPVAGSEQLVDVDAAVPAWEQLPVRDVPQFQGWYVELETAGLE